MGKYVLYLLFAGINSLVVSAQTTYHSANHGNWSSPSTWAGGQVPPCKIEDNAKIVISHTVTYDMQDDLVVEKGDLRIPGGSLLFPFSGTGSGRSVFVNQQGRLYIFNGELKMPINSSSSGNLKIEKGKVDIISSTVSIAQNWQNVQDHLEIITSCIQVGENYQSDHSHEIIDRSCIEIGLQGSGNFDNDRGNIKVNRASFLLRGTSGNFNNKNHQSKIEHHGSSNVIGILVLDVPGNLENNGIWKANVADYCVDGNIQGSAAGDIDFMGSENCAYVNSFACDCGLQEIPLPVNLISFSGVASDQEHKLQWKVSDEVNLQLYGVERSFDGRSFNSIGFVTATNSTQYNFSAESINGRAYYRLKMMDQDGSFEYSQIIRLNNKQQDIIEISPNPFMSHITMNLNINDAAPYSFRLIDMSGKLVKQKQERLSRGRHSITLDGLESLTPGMFTLVVANGSTNEVYSEKVIKR